jgi:mannose-6-phosphate isomerase-like protein (cupin superfamily)
MIMSVVRFSEVEKFDFPGIAHQTIASRAHGAKGIELWKQKVEPDAATPVHLHECEEVVVVLQGSGRLIMDGRISEFEANSTLIIPPDTVHQILNTGREELFIIGCFNSSPVAVYSTDGEKIVLPW